ncbi:MAG TPA: hypothetical protein VIT91_09940 [Chthoniobacterales bacterium]
MSELLSAEQIVHRQREWQQGDKIPRGFAVDESGRKRLVSDF